MTDDKKRLAAALQRALSEGRLKRAMGPRCDGCLMSYDCGESGVCHAPEKDRQKAK